MLSVDKMRQIAVFDGSRVPSDFPQLILTLHCTGTDTDTALAWTLISR